MARARCYGEQKLSGDDEQLREGRNKLPLFRRERDGLEELDKGLIILKGSTRADQRWRWEMDWKTGKGLGFGGGKNTRERES